MTRKSPPPFKEEDKIKILLWSERHCCLCDKPCDTNIIIHHILQKGTNEELSNIDNAIPLCHDCHGRIKSYNLSHRVGTSYRINEVKTRRNQIYDKYTRHLVPIVTFDVETNTQTFPTIHTIVIHASTSLPVKARIEVKHILNLTKDLGIMKDEHGYYSGETEWNLNPARRINGNYTLPEECQNSEDDLKIEARLTIIDQYDRHHVMLPQAWTFDRNTETWFLEPRSFTTWEHSLPLALL
jgi:hypothetical protein